MFFSLICGSYVLRSVTNTVNPDSVALITEKNDTRSEPARLSWTGRDSLVSDVEPRPHFVRVVTGGFPRVQEPLQLRHAEGTGDPVRVLPVRRPGAAPGPGEPGHESHLLSLKEWKQRMKPGRGAERAEPRSASVSPGSGAQ